MQDIRKIGALAHLDIPESEVGKFRTELELILSYVRQLDELDLDGVEPTVYGQPLVNVFRADEARAWQGADSATANAPERVGLEFKVPKIVE